VGIFIVVEEGTMPELDLHPGEVELGRWTLNLLPHGGGRFAGPLTVTNKRLLFRGKFGDSIPGALGAFIILQGEWGYVSIPKERIKKTVVVDTLLKKKVALTLTDGSVHTLDYGMLSVDKIVEAIRKN
jgi:hypothetical protein